MLRAAGKKTKQNKGAALIEYGIIVSLIGIVSIGTVSALGEQIKSIYGGAASAIAMGNAIASNGANGIDPCGDLGEGEECASDNTTYIGDSASGRLYVEFEEMGFGEWMTGGSSTLPNQATNTGLQNTKALLAHGVSNGYTYNLAEACSNMGPGWFMPSYDELKMLDDYVTNDGQDSQAIFGTYRYGSSSTNDVGSAFLGYRFGDTGVHLRSTNAIVSFVCMRTYEAP